MKFLSIIYNYLQIVHQKESCGTLSLCCLHSEGQKPAMISMILYFLENVADVRNIKITYLSLGHTMMPVLFIGQ